MNDSPDRYVIACQTDWFWDQWTEFNPKGQWRQVREPEELTYEMLGNFQPRFVFFPHWSHIVADEIIENFECVCFHATPLPYGRGGSPIQNMIVRGHEETKVTALRMTGEVDAGPIYMQEDFSLLGGGDEMYIRLSEEILGMIERLVTHPREPEPQEGQSVVFERRTPSESSLPEESSLQEIFDFIRMLDAEGYPNAFIEHGDLRIEFSRPARRRGKIEADVTIRRNTDKED